MKLPFLRFAIGATMLFAVNSASASLIGHTTELLGGGTLNTDVTPASATVGAGHEYEVCVNGDAITGCATSGLKILVDIGDFYVEFTFSGSTGAVNTGDNFALELDVLDFIPPESIVGITPDGYLNSLSFGTFVVIGTVGPDSISFQGLETNEAIGVASGGLAPTAGTALRFDIALSGAEAPEPGALALFGLALAGMGFARRRIAA